MILQTIASYGVCSPRPLYLSCISPCGEPTFLKSHKVSDLSAYQIIHLNRTQFIPTSNGCPVENPEAYQRVGSNGPLLLQDFHLIDLLAHFDRQRIPERVVHAKGAGAYGGMLFKSD